jgi:hypothetical protein
MPYVDSTPGHRPTPDEEPPTPEQLAEAIVSFVAYRPNRILKVTLDAIHDGLARGCLRWYYLLYPVEFEIADLPKRGRIRQPTKYERRLVIERQYRPISGGITTEWNAWCVEWGLPAMQVFTRAQREKRIAEGLPTDYPEPAPVAAPRYRPGEVGDAAEVEQAIVKASEEYGLDLEEDHIDIRAVEAEPDPMLAAAEAIGMTDPLHNVAEQNPYTDLSKHITPRPDLAFKGTPTERDAMVSEAVERIKTGQAIAPPKQKEKRFWED